MTKDNHTLNRAIDALRDTTIPAGPPDELMRQTMTRIEQTHPQTTPCTAGKRSILMKSLTKLSIAAVVLLGVSTFFLSTRTPGSIALADVYSRVQQARTFMYTMAMTMSGMGEMMGQPDAGSTTAEGSVIISTEYGMKLENRIQTRLPDGTTQQVTQLAYMLPNDKIIVSIMPDQKIYQTIELTDQLLEETKKQNNDPREMIRQMMNCEYVSLGQSEINGIRVQGFETTDPAYSAGVGGNVRAVLWVNADTWLPVQSEVSMTMGEKMNIHIVIRDFQWDVPVDAADFAYVIPDDYKEFGSFKMPEMNEEAAVEGLRLYSKLFDQYPDNLDIASLVPSLMKNLKELLDNPKTEYAIEFSQKMKAVANEGEQTRMQQTQQVLAPITSLAMFYMKLSQNKHDPVYYGRTVTPGDGTAVLLRWRQDNGLYKVIFGDLDVAEMTYEDLRAIEPENKPQPESAPESPSPGIDDPAAQAAHIGTHLTQFGQSAMNIKRMLLACYNYSQNSNDQWPDTLDTLRGEGIEADLLINPARPELANGYIYLKPAIPEDLQHNPDKKIVIYEAYEQWGSGIYVGFADGHVEFVKDEADFLKRLQE